jgi:CheY-like chemotaxis protein
MLGRIEQSRVQLKEGEDRLRAAKEAAETANAAKDNFLAILSHELRTPLTPVLTTVALLEKDPAFAAAARADLEMIRRNVEVEARLIDDLLDVTRIARGKLELHTQLVDARALLEHALQNYCLPQARLKNVQVRFEITADQFHVVADPSRLTQVFWNLLQNAVKFTPEDGVIELRMWNSPVDPGQSDSLMVSVTDSGIGIDPEFLPRIFDAFEQGERSRTRTFGGLGLGLAISRALVELHGGSLRAESAGLGHGARFTLSLQTAAAPAAPLAVAPSAGQPSEVPDALRILLVEDHADTARQLSRLLTRSGHRVVTAHSIAEARACLVREEGSFDVLLSDLGLPDGSGHELMREFRGTVPVHAIALSGYGMDTDIAESLAAGFDAHLTKPVDWDELKATLERLTRATKVSKLS